MVACGDQGNERNRREIGHRIVERLLVERLIVGVGSHAAERDLVAVGGGAGDPGGSGHAAGARNILDVKLLSKSLA